MWRRLALPALLLVGPSAAWPNLVAPREPQVRKHESPPPPPPPRSVAALIQGAIGPVHVAAADALSIAITGSSQGIGLDAARRLIASGHAVYHLARTAERARVAVDAAGGGLPVVCDLEDLSSVRAAAALRREPALDVLVLNAAYAPGMTQKVCPRTKDGFERCLGVNHLCLLYTSPSPRDKRQSRMPSSA